MKRQIIAIYNYPVSEGIANRLVYERIVKEASVA